MARILIVDDEETLCEALRFNLEAEGFEVDTANSAEEALTLNLSSYSLLIFDIMMGEISGTQLASIVKKREDTASIPIIFCSAKDEEDDVVSGLDLGADDYITKPFSFRTLLARVKSVLRRASQNAEPSEHDDEISYKGLSLSRVQKRCTVDGTEVRMPRKEFEILSLLLSHPGRIFSRDELLKNIWEEDVVVVDRVIDVNITRLRSKLGSYGKNIVTRSGYGYGFME